MAVTPSFPHAPINLYRFFRTPNFPCSQAEGEGQQIHIGFMTAHEAECLASTLEQQLSDNGQYSVHWVRELPRTDPNCMARVDALLAGLEAPHSFASHLP